MLGKFLCSCRGMGEMLMSGVIGGQRRIPLTAVVDLDER